MGGGPPREKKPMDNSKYYQLLGVEKDASQIEIKKAFRKVCVVCMCAERSKRDRKAKIIMLMLVMMLMMIM